MGNIEAFWKRVSLFVFRELFTGRLSTLAQQEFSLITVITMIYCHIIRSTFEQQSSSRRKGFLESSNFVGTFGRHSSACAPAALFTIGLILGDTV